MRQIIIPQYPRKIRIAEKQKPRYYTWDGQDFVYKNKPAPERYRNGNYIGVVILKGKDIGWVDWDVRNARISTTIIPEEARIYLADGKGFRVVANPKTVGTPKEQRINFQDLYSGNLHEHTRSTLVNKLKDFMRPFVVNLPVIVNYPVKISLELHDTVKNATDNSKDEYGRAFDIDNRSIVYFKCFLDLLVSEGILVSDDRLFVSAVGGVTFVPLATSDDTFRQLVFTIEQDTRPEIQNHPLYINFHTNRNVESKRDRGTTEPW